MLLPIPFVVFTYKLTFFTIEKFGYSTEVSCGTPILYFCTIDIEEHKQTIAIV